MKRRSTMTTLLATYRGDGGANVSMSKRPESSALASRGEVRRGAIDAMKVRLSGPRTSRAFGEAVLVRSDGCARDLLYAHAFPSYASQVITDANLRDQFRMPQKKPGDKTIAQKNADARIRAKRERENQVRRRMQ